jgi:hypothetical protein
MLDAVVPTPNLEFVRTKVYNLSLLAKRPGGWIRTYGGRQWSSKGIQKKK